MGEPRPAELLGAMAGDGEILGLLVPVLAPAETASSQAVSSQAASSQAAPRQAAYEPFDAHEAACHQPRCQRCFFMAGMRGRLRKGCRGLQAAKATLAWSTRPDLKFVDPRNEAERLWVCVRPPSWGGEWAVGCYVCNLANICSSFGRVDLRERVDLCKLIRHSTCKGHAAALRSLVPSASSQACVADVGIMSGVEGVPRLDRWLAVLGALVDRDSFRDVQRQIGRAVVGSALPEGGPCRDGSRHLPGKVLSCLSEPLRRLDLKVIARAKAMSIALDERAQVLLVYARILTRKGELYETLLGLSRDYGVGHENCLAALQQIMQRACTRRRGRRSSPCDTVEDFALQRLRQSMRAGASDGGPQEVKCLYEASSQAQDAARKADPVFPNLAYIFRDAPHRHRSVQKRFWNDLGESLRAMLRRLIDGDRSLAKMMGSSRKLSLVFEDKQRAALMALSQEAQAANQVMRGPEFDQVLRHFQYAEQRFDSRSMPLFKIFKLLPVALDAVEEIARSGDAAEVAWAIQLLDQHAGPEGYEEHDRCGLGGGHHDDHPTGHPP